MSPSAVPEGCPELNTKCVEAMLHISDMLHDDIHQVGSGLAAVTWLLLYFGLRRKHPAFLALKQLRFAEGDFSFSPWVDQSMFTYNDWESTDSPFSRSYETPCLYVPKYV